MKKVNVTISNIFLLLLACIVSNAQNAKPLTVGDRLPDLEFSMINYVKPTANFFDFKGKNILIDCWATWCAPCVAGIIKKDSIEKLYPDDLVILPVTDEDRSLIETFSKRLLTVKKIRLVSAVNDKSIATLFPHRTVPHFIWIGKDGIVKAITGEEELTATNLNSFVNGQSLAKLPVKKDMVNDNIAASEVASVETLSGKDANAQKAIIQKDSNLIFFSALTPFAIDGTGGASVRGQFLLSSNIGILSLFACAYGNGDVRTFWAGNNTEVTTKDSLLFFPNAGLGRKDVTTPEYEKWRVVPGRCFNYILKVPEGASQAIKCTRMQNDLAVAFPFLSAKIEQRPGKEIYVLKKLSADTSQFATRGGEFAMNATRINLTANNVLMGRVVSEMQHFFEASEIKDIVNETGFKGRVDINIEVDMTKPDQINDALKKYGLTLVKERRTKNVLVLVDHRTDEQIKAYYDNIKAQQAKDSVSKN